MEVLLITILLIINLVLVLALIIAHSFIRQYKTIINDKEKIIGALVECNDYVS